MLFQSYCRVLFQKDGGPVVTKNDASHFLKEKTELHTCVHFAAPYLLISIATYMLSLYD